MGCCYSSFNKRPKIDETPKGQECNYLKHEGKITDSIDNTDDVPIVEIAFNGWYMNSVRSF